MLNTVEIYYSAIYNKPSPAEGFVVNDEEGRFEAPGKGGSLPGAGRRKYAGGHSAGAAEATELCERQSLSLLIKKLPENNAVFQFNKSYKDFCK